MDADVVDGEVARVAAAIGEPARARMLFGVLDGRARTSTELAALADVTASTASAHLQRLVAVRLLQVDVQGRQRPTALRAPWRHAPDSVCKRDEPINYALTTP